MLAEEGLKAQARAPMTPVVKLVFGAQYDKTRLTEFAAALSWAKREGVPAGALAKRIEAEGGGLNGRGRAERVTPRREARPLGEIRGAAFAPPLAKWTSGSGEGEFVLLVARRDADGLAIVAPVSDSRLIEQAIRKTAA